jgi:predicted nuclease with RNAse H fold
MNSTDAIYIGIDPTSGSNEFVYAVLDVHLNLVTMAEADMEEMLSFLVGQASAFVAINAPAGVNHGVVKQRLAEKSSGPGRSVRGADIRLAEYELRVRGIAVAGTPAREEYCPSWMQVGFALHRKLSRIDFRPYRANDSSCQVLETHPFACFCVLAESIPLSQATLEGRLQRQLILNDKGLRIKDGMEFFEEITRFKLMRGILPEDVLYTPEQLDVLVAAYTAWLSANRPEEVIRVGDEDEGQMVLPANELKAKYKKTGDSPIIVKPA